MRFCIVALWLVGALVANGDPVRDVQEWAHSARRGVENVQEKLHLGYNRPGGTVSRGKKRNRGVSTHAALKPEPVSMTREEALGVSHLVGKNAYYPPWDPRGEVGRRNMMLVVAGLFLCMLLVWRYSTGHHGTVLASPRDQMKRSHKKLDEDTYGFAIASLIRDSQMISTGRCSPRLRITRIVFSIALLAINVGIQLFMMAQIKQFVTSKWVHNIRADYSEYEMHMYDGDIPGHTTLTVNGRHRGIAAYMHPQNFDTMSNDLKERVCQVPFSQAGFFMAVLLIWALTCLGEIRKCVSIYRSLIFSTPTIDHMSTSLSDLDTGELESDKEEGEREWIVDGLTTSLKVVITWVVLFPRLVVTVLLLWLGSRFLAATNDFSEMVLNAIALEFILMVKDLLYTTIVADRNKREINNINIKPSTNVDNAGFWSYLGTFSWFIVSMGWVVFYLYCLQMVLPDYNWDVHNLCVPWLEHRFAV